MSDEPKPLTDEDLSDLWGLFAAEGQVHPEDSPPFRFEPYTPEMREAKRKDIARALMELKRLRSDEWLCAASDEIDDFWWDEPSAGDPIGTMVAILRKHRDKKA